MNFELFCDTKHWQDMDMCTKTEASCLDNKHKKVVFKDLSLIWKEGDYSKSNTVLLDDSPYKALLNPVSLSTKSFILIQKQFYCLIDVLDIMTELSDFTATYSDIPLHIQSRKRE